MAVSGRLLALSSSSSSLSRRPSAARSGRHPCSPATGLYGGPALSCPISMRVLVLSFALCYAAVSLVFRRAGKRAEREILPACRHASAGKSVALRALRDTGNGLYDPVSGRAVAVAELDAVRPAARPAYREAPPTPRRSVRRFRRLPGLAGRVDAPAVFRHSAQATACSPRIRPDSSAVSGQAGRTYSLVCPPPPLSQDGDYDAII